jgi:hypothetical protein
LTEVTKERSDLRHEIDDARRELDQKDTGQMQAFEKLKRKYASLDREFTQLISQLE